MLKCGKKTEPFRNLPVNQTVPIKINLTRINLKSEFYNILFTFFFIILISINYLLIVKKTVLILNIINVKSFFAEFD